MITFQYSRKYVLKSNFFLSCNFLTIIQIQIFYSSYQIFFSYTLTLHSSSFILSIMFLFQNEQTVL